MAGIYVHIPFCRNICNYCDFHHSASLESQDAMVEAIVQEIQHRAGFFDDRSALGAPSIDTIYFGGGTPSVCSPAQIDRIIRTIRRIWGPTSGKREVTLEANPEDLTPDYLKALRAAGVDRLSIGIQSFVAEHLQWMNRHHSPADACRAVEHARAAGFDNITIDLMYGLPMMSLDQWKDNLQQAATLAPEHISAYHLTIEPRTVFGKRGLKPVDEQVSQLHFDTLRHTLLGNGYEHYEVSNFARPGRRAIHNSNYWTGMPYLGVGPGAHSFDGQACRSWNVAGNRPYLRGVPPEVEPLTAEDRFNETVMTRLRTTDGLPLNLLSAQQAERLLLAASRWIDRGYMYLRENTEHAPIGREKSAEQPTSSDAGILAIHAEHFLISDSMIADFFV